MPAAPCISGSMMTAASSAWAWPIFASASACAAAKASSADRPRWKRKTWGGVSRSVSASSGL